MVRIKEKIRLKCEDNIQSPIRLDQYLFSKLPQYSRSYFQNLINEDLVIINGKTVKKNSYKIHDQDLIEINIPEETPINLTPQKVDFEIVDIQKDFVIINKPAGLLVHHAPNNVAEKSLVNGLLYQFKELSDFEDKERPGIIHRLDKDTSGLLIVARNIPAQIKLSQMLKDKKITKKYLVLVKGHPEKSGKIDFDIGRHPIKRHMMSHLGISPRKALTYYKVLAYYKDCSLVEATIVTGRTHQIRVHFAAIGHGVIGDSVYGFNSKHINRQALHSWKISFEFNGKQYSYQKPVPQDFQKLLKVALKNTL